jgi:SAM-dependent methyltransferase
MIDIIKFNDQIYPKFQSEGNAAQFAIPYAKKFCNGFGYDIGCMKIEWAFPGAFPIDLIFDDEFHANNLPEEPPDYIFSSHCLEHIDNWVETLDYWTDRLKNDGVLFLYLPDYSQHYWRPWHNIKHKHVFNPNIIKDYMIDRKFTNIFVSGIDLNNSFMIVGNKCQ